MCSMNIAWRAGVHAAMYFLLMGPDYPFDRFGDIWGGVLAKRVADHLGLAVNSGSPGVLHERASNVFVNLAKESRGLGVNETFWRAVDSVVLTADSCPAALLRTRRPAAARATGVRTDPAGDADLGRAFQRAPPR